MPDPLTMFIGSSTEGLPVATALGALLEGSATVRLWNQGVFAPGLTYIESLERALDASDFAVLVLTPDDVTVSRRKEKSAPRDNVLFELGLFIGRIGRTNSYFLAQEGVDLKLPSDLLGVTPASYRHPVGETLEEALRPVAGRIRAQLAGLTPRRHADVARGEAQSRLGAFCERVCGDWWERVLPVDTVALSYIRVRSDSDTGTIRMDGRAFGADGAPVASWASKAACVDPDDAKVFYYWSGVFRTRPDEPFEGLGEITFSETDGAFDTGSGVFSETSLRGVSNTTRKYFELRRCSGDEVTVLRGGDRARISRVVSKRIAAMG